MGIALPTVTSLDAALKAAKPGDTIEVNPGVYPGQVVTFDPAKEGATARVKVIAQGAKLNGNLDWNGGQHAHVVGLEVGGLWNIRLSTVNQNKPASKQAGDLLFESMIAKTFLWRNVNGITLRNSTIGGWDASKTPLGPPKVGAYIAEDGAPPRLSTGVLVERVLFRDMLRTVSGTAHAEGFYFDAGVDGAIIRECFFTNCAVFDIFSNGQAAGRPITNIVIEDNLLDIPRGLVGDAAASAINFKGGSGKVTLRRNSILGNVRLDPGEYDWTSEKNAIWGTSTKPGTTDVISAANPGFVSARKDSCDLNACYRNDLHVKADTPAGRAGAGVPVNGTPPPVDTQAPTVAITSPADGADLQDTIVVTVTATDNVGVARVQVYVDGVPVGTDAAAPYSMNFDTTSVADGPHVIEARALDAAGNIGTAEVSCRVTNTADPTVDELIDKAVAAFKATTVTYPVWQAKVAAGDYPDVKATKWWQGFDWLEQAKAKAN